ncbi:MAG TPA: DNA polymerase [Rectinemataceae bacterium]|nr:DNA polymerase [Rectinemataceae bacterium]
MNAEASVIHVNVIGFMSAVERLMDPALERRAFVVAHARASRALVLDASRNALAEGIEPGMYLDSALRRVRGLLVVEPAFDRYADANLLIEKVCARYAPLLENDSGGHFYLDVRGTRRLFGEYVGTAARIRNEIASTVGLEPAITLAANKLVAKVGTRSLRPEGLALIREGDEAAFLAPQNVQLLPGVGPKILRLLGAVGIREIGELAAVDDAEIRALFGHEGPALRDGARGLDSAPVADGRLPERRIVEEARFESDVIDGFDIRACLLDLATRAGLRLRREALEARQAALEVTYTDGVASSANAGASSVFSSDADLLAIADRLLVAAHLRRVRLRALKFSLGALSPASRQLDLFAPPEPGKAERFQAAADAARKRFGADKLKFGAAFGRSAYARV